MAVCVTETTVSEVRFPKQQLHDVALNGIAINISVISIVWGSRVVREVPRSQSGASLVPDAVGVSSLEISTQLDRVISLDPRQMFRPVPGLVGPCRNRITLHASDVPAVVQVI